MSLLPFVASVFEPEYAADWLMADPRGGQDMLSVADRPFSTRQRYSARVYLTLTLPP
jgi:hypothetical protein